MSETRQGIEPPAQAVKRRSPGGRVARVMAWTVGGLLLLLLLLCGGFAWYTTTSDFQHRVRAQLIKTLEDATGGRVELAGISFDLWHLAVEADGLVIHGLEGPGEAPYLSADKLAVRVKLFSFFSHTAGTGVASHVGLNYLRIDHPQVHLIIDKNGKTNQPVPKHKSTSTTPLTDTLLDLKAKQVILANGVALLNDRAIPFDLAAHDLDAEVHYISTSDRYGATIDLKDLRTRMAKEPEAQSALHIEAELGRDAVDLKALHLHTGASSNLDASASLNHFAKPEWQAKVTGSLELAQVAVLSDVDGLKAGTLELEVNGHNCETTPAVAQKHPHFWQRSHPKAPGKPSTEVLPPDPDCKAGYLLAGKAKLHNAGYRDEYVRLHDINGGADLRITPTELLFTALTGYLPDGGSAKGELRISNWLGEVPSNAATASPTTNAAVKTANTTAKAVGAKEPITGSTQITAVQTAHAYLKVTTDRIPLRTIMDVTAPQNYGDLGFDTALSGPVNVEWGGPAKDIASSVIVDGDLRLAPTGVRRRGALSDIPVSGQVLAHYSGVSEIVRIERMDLETPKSSLTGNGVLGVANGDPLTDLKVNLTVRDLAEYDQLLQTLGFEANGKKGSAAIPVVLHGALHFDGTAKGAIQDLDVKGHLQGEQIEAKLGTAEDVLIDSVVADAEYSPNEGLAVGSSTIHRGTALLHVDGSLRPREVMSKRHVKTYLWDDGMAVDARLSLADAQMTDLLQIAGQQQKIPVSGVVAANGHAKGTLKNLVGGGQITLRNGVAYDEPFDSMVADVTAQGKEVDASSLVLKLHGMQVTGNGGYNMETQHFHGHLEGRDLVLSKFVSVQKAQPNTDAVLTLVADANGTTTQPGVKASLQLAKVAVNGQQIGDLTANVHSEAETVFFTADSNLVGAKLNGAGQMKLVGDYPMQAKVTLTGLDVAKPIAMFAPNKVEATSLIDGVVTVSGPVKTPKNLSGQAEFGHFDVKLQGVELKTLEPLRVSLQNGVARLEQLHITGQDTDMRASGTAQVFGVTDPKGGRLDLQGSGSVSLALLHTFDRDIISSGKVEFQVAAGGKTKSPALTGKVQFDDVNIAMDGIPNGLSKMNGTLVFNEDRLQVQTLTATTGGGQLKLGGFLTYHNGVYADLTATGDVVRVRLYGLSATANANFRLQGGPQNATLSGNILLTRFGIGPDVDFAQFAGAGGVSAPPDPNSATNKVRLDVHVTSSPQLDFQNSYAKLAGTVDLTIRGTVAEPTVLGRIQITDGSATFAGTKYQLQRGDIYFTNPVRIDPIIDLDATARVENYDITIGLHGTTTSLKPTYRSEPPLSQADVFALLALGRTQEEAQLYQEQQIQAGTDPTTSSLLGGALNATVSSRVEKLFGVGSVKIDPAFVGTLGNSSARITVQQQLSRQLTATFATNINSTAQQLIQLQYELNHNTSIVATRDESGVFSVVYKLRRRYR